MKPSKKVSNMDVCNNLIREVRVRPPLWNEKDENWKNKELTCKLWNDVGNGIGTSGPVARTKWNNLRDRYNCEISKQIAAADCNCEFKSKWAFFEYMKFLESSGHVSSHRDQNIGGATMKYSNLERCGQDPRMVQRHMNQNGPKLGQLNGIVDLCDICKNAMQQQGLMNMNMNGHCNDHGKGNGHPELKRLKQQRVCKDTRELEDENNDNQDIKVYVQKKFKTGSSSSSFCRQPELVVAMSQSKQSDMFIDEQINTDPCSAGPCSDMPCSGAEEPEKQQTKENPIKISTVKPGKPHNNPNLHKEVKKNDVECQKNIEAIDKKAPPVKEESERKDNPNCQFLMSLLPYLDQLNQVDCLELRSQIQCLINDAYRRRQHGCSHLHGMR